MQRVWRSYESSLARSPLLTKMATSLVGFSLGDWAAQRLGAMAAARGAGHRGAKGGREDSTGLGLTADAAPFEMDWARTLRMAAFGTFLQATTGHIWYDFLDRTVLPHAPRSLRAVMSKVALDQLAYSPVMNAVFLTFCRTLEGRGDEVLATLEQRWLPIMKANYALWPAAHVLGFMFVPTRLRILYINVVALAWNTILSMAANDNPAAPKIKGADVGKI